MCCFVALGWLGVCNRRMKDVHFAVLQVNQAFVSTLVCGSVLAFQCIQTKSLPFRYDSYWIYLELVAAALANFVGQTLYTIAQQKANPATVQLLAYVGVFYMFCCDYFVFHLTISPIQYVGVSLCLTSCVGVVIYKMISNPEKAK